jgi:hypothetical protein
MKGILYIFFFSFIALNVSAQKDTAFISTFGGLQNTTGAQVKTTYDKGYILIGTTNSSGCGNTDMYAVKTDSLGNKQWSKTYGGQLNEEGFSVEQTFDHGYVFLGLTNSFGKGGYDVYLVKTDSAGNFQWQRTYGDSNWDFGYSIKQLTDSGFVIVGQTYSYGKGNGDVYVIRTDKNGDTLWTRAVGDTGYDVGNSVTVVRDSLYYIVGATTSFSKGDTDMYFIKMNNKGVVIKDTIWGNSPTNRANSINPTQNNAFVIYGYTDTLKAGHMSMILMEIDTNLRTNWIQIYNCPLTSEGNDALQFPDGNFGVVATSNCFGLGGYAMNIVLAYPAGWFITGASFGGTGDEQGNSIALAKNGNVVFLGSSNSPGYTYGLSNMYMVRVKNDSITNNYYLVVRNFKDTSICYLGIPSASVIPPGVKLFPNPVSASATILVQGDIGEHYSLNVYNELGQIVLTSPLASAAHGQSVGHIEKGSLSPGTYIYGIANKEGDRVAAGKFIIE